MTQPARHHGTFAFLLHPLRIDDFARKYPITRRLPASWVERAFTWIPPRLVSHISGIRSATGATAEGWFIGLPLTPRTLLNSPLPFVYRRLIEAGRKAEALGAKIFGLGAFTKIVGDRGLTVARKLGIAVTADQILEVFRPDLAARVWQAHRPAGIDIPLRFHVYEDDGRTWIRFRTPSEVFARHRAPALDRLAQELDPLFARALAALNPYRESL